MDKLRSRQYQYFEEINPGLLRKVGSGLRILDVGCGAGTLGQAMAEKGNTVFGVDISPAAIERAKPRLHFAAVGDVTDPHSLPEEIRQHPFDLIVLGDVLEHVYDPASLLLALRTLLKPDGRLLVSVPNVANWMTRLQLLCGRWEYAVSGVMDRTHVRFFTLKTARRLLRAAGYVPTDVSATPYFSRAFAVSLRNLLFPDSQDQAPPDPAALMKSRCYQFYLRCVFPVERAIAQLWKTMFAFQFIIVAKPTADSTAAGRTGDHG